MEIAKRSDWKSSDMPEKNETFILNRAFDEKQLKVLRRGNIPQEMEDKWFWYMEGNKLYAHRSWTGYCIYIIEFSADNAHKVTVNRDPEQYKCTSTDEDIKKLNTLLDWWCEEKYDYYHEWLSETMAPLINSQNTDMMLKSGLNFVMTGDKQYQERLRSEVSAKSLKNGGSVFLDDKPVPIDDFRRDIFYVNLREKGFFQKRRRFRSLIDVNSKLVKALDIQPKVFDMRLQQLWHWSYLCSCAIGISEGKRYLIFPWINSTECSIQSYMFMKLYEYTVKNGIAVLIPTDSVRKLEMNKMEGFVYNILNGVSSTETSFGNTEEDNAMFCKIFVDSSLEFSSFFGKISKYAGASDEDPILHSLSTEWCDMDVRRNDYYDEKEYSRDKTDFVYWRYYIEVYSSGKAEKDVYTEKLRELISFLKTFCGGAVPACDFEDELNDR
ncbi:MAG: hypothetical protein IKW96_13240 [Ruminococcus sp.]|uniref:hypothetical protein n=1 Tax=Ruminococcus sp. TaxID=41978 RepID=UPI0025EABC75|nr:hypothetical protein [Ruminococcus sp.]MBR5684212.1 hypothetical protein [Ruminococcus sp.]